MIGPLDVGAARLTIEVWRLAARGVISQRSPAADAALDLRDMIDSEWMPELEGDALEQAIQKIRGT